MKCEENKKDKLECRKRIECMKKLSWISLGVSLFYRELQKIFMDDHLQVIIVVENLIFDNIYSIEKSLIMYFEKTLHSDSFKNTSKENISIKNTSSKNIIIHFK